MAKIVPFRGVHYDAWRVGGLDAVVAPPYDVISPAEQMALYATGPNNIIRLILNRAETGDDEEAPYRRAEQFLRGAQASGVLVQDPEPALYVYTQEFTNPADGQRYRRTALFCALELEPYSAGVVLPHEETRTKAKEDRLRLMRATASNPEPIYGLYEDPEGFVARTLERAGGGEPADLSVTINGDSHEVRRLRDPETVAAIQAFLAPAKVWIADGHHRYETALAYRDERRASASVMEEGVEAGDPDWPPYDYILIALTAFSDPGLVVLPTHRLVRNIPPDRLERLPALLDPFFEVEEVPFGMLPGRMQGSPAEGVHRFGLVSRTAIYVITLREPSAMADAVEEHSDAWKRLDVSILQTLALDRALGIPSASLATTPDLAYTRDWNEAIDAVRRGDFQFAFLLNHPSADEVRQVAAAGDKMPPKSTFFYPKLWNGLILRLLR